MKNNDSLLIGFIIGVLSTLILSYTLIHVFDFSVGKDPGKIEMIKK